MTQLSQLSTLLPENNKVASQSNDVSFKSLRYTPQSYNPERAAVDRIGVPGHRIYAYDSCSSIVRAWSGTSFQSVFTSFTFFIHVFLFSAASTILNSIAKNTPHHSAIEASLFPGFAASTLMTLTIFTLTFYVSQVFSRWNARFENICKLNGNVTRMTALAAGTLSRKEAIDVIRYTHAINHIYHLLTGSLSAFEIREGYNPLLERGILTNLEVDVLCENGSPAVVLYAWATRIINKSFTGSSKGSPSSILGALEECIGGTRGLSAKNIAYSHTQIPFVYFHFKSVLVHIFILCIDWDSAIFFTKAASMSCDHLVSGDSLLDDEDTSSESCLTGMIIIVFAQILLTFIFLGLLFLSDSLSDMYGDYPYSYDPGVDLDGLWTESQNVIESIGQPTDNEKKEYRLRTSDQKLQEGSDQKYQTAHGQRKNDKIIG